MYREHLLVLSNTVPIQCKHQRQLTSQPCIKDPPARNTLLLAAILFNGATPGKVLRILNHMKVTCFTDKTFYYHQHDTSVQPAVVSVWGQSS